MTEWALSALAAVALAYCVVQTGRDFGEQRTGYGLWGSLACVSATLTLGRLLSVLIARNLSI